VPLTGIDAVAVTAGPGLIGGLMVGLMTAKAIAMAASKPLYGINHLEGHALTARLTDNVAFPYLLLLVSGGHTQIVLVKGVNDYERWGTTIDDALGEAFDKTAKLLGLPYPGGPAVEQAALSGEAQALQAAGADAARSAAGLFLLRPENRGAADGRTPGAAVAADHCRSLSGVSDRGDRQPR
jgi:glycoprotease/Kae1 family metallohydrolase